MVSNSAAWIKAPKQKLEVDSAEAPTAQKGEVVVKVSRSIFYSRFHSSRILIDSCFPLTIGSLRIDSACRLEGEQLESSVVLLPKN